MIQPLRRALQWAYHSPLLGGYAYLTASEPALAARGPQGVAWWGVMFASLLWGPIYMMVWSAGYTLFDSRSDMPALLTAVVMLLWAMRQPMVSLGRLASRDAATRALTLGVIAAAVVVLMQSLREPDFAMEGPLPWYVPFEKHFRVLIVAPLWGGWAIMIAPKLCRPGQRTDIATATLARTCGPLISAGLMALPLVLSLEYLRRWMGWPMFLPLTAPLLTALVAPFLLCRGGGVTRRTLLASSALTQVAFLLAYLAARYFWTSRY